MRYFLLGALLLLPVGALGADAPTSFDQSLSNRLMQELNASVQCGAEVIELQKQLKAADDQLTELKKVPTK